MQSTPRALKSDTIFECVLEVRCAPGHESAAQLIPGMVFGDLGDLFQRLINLPLASAPKELLAIQPQLAYQVTHRLEGSGPMLLVGPRSVAVTFVKPYPGWASVMPIMVRCVNAVLKTKLLGAVERCSIRFVNLLSVGRDENDLSQLKLNLQLDGFILRKEGIAVRAEIEVDGCISVVEIMSGATVTNSEGRFGPATGVLCNVDTVRLGPFKDFQRELPTVLEQIHNTEKKIYFGLLSDDTLARLEPVWD
ncbi:MAG: TIGR04255 family protein [Steroidobacteraceae bacterium]